MGKGLDSAAYAAKTLDDIKFAFAISYLRHIEAMRRHYETMATAKAAIEAKNEDGGTLGAIRYDRDRVSTSHIADPTADAALRRGGSVKFYEKAMERAERELTDFEARLEALAKTKKDGVIYLDLRYTHQMEPHEIAAMMGVDVKTIYNKSRESAIDLYDTNLPLPYRLSTAALNELNQIAHKLASNPDDADAWDAFCDLVERVRPREL